MATLPSNPGPNSPTGPTGPAGPTGPRTPEGKAISSKNARKHGYTSGQAYVPPELEDDYRALFEGFLRDLQPQGELENHLFIQIVRHAWNTRRIAQRQVDLAEAGFDPFGADLLEERQKEYHRLEQYHSRNASAMRSTLRELRHLQTDRAVQSVLPPPLGQGALSALVKPTEILRLAKRTDPGFAKMAMETLVSLADEQLRWLPRYYPGPAIVPDTEICPSDPK